MVDKESIDKIFTDIISNIKVKCPTIAEMHTKIDDMRTDGATFNDMMEQLKDENQINPLEYEDYKSTLKSYDKTYKEWDKSKVGTDKYEQLFDELMNMEEYLFQYNRRLFDGGVKRNEAPVVDESSFITDKNLSNDDVWVKNGTVENNQIEAQRKGLDLGTKTGEFTETTLFDDSLKYTYEQYDDPRLMSMGNYFNGDCTGINYTISHKGYLNALNDEQRKNVKDIDSLMEDNVRLIEDTILYRGGHWDIHLNVGDHSRGFKGYQSTTFQEKVAKNYKSHYKEQTGDKGMLIRILAPKGTKGVCGNDNRFYNGFTEHEFTLPRNLGYTVVDIDYKKMVATVILDES